MVQSMTGYASSVIEIPIKNKEKLSLSVHMKSLNSRYFEATCKLPYLLSNLEVAMHRQLKKKLHRGHVYITIKVQQDTVKHSIIPSMSTVQGYMQAIKTIKKECDISEEVSLQTLLKLPNILQVEEESLTKKTEELILQEIDTLTDQLVTTRVTEGKALVVDIKQQTKSITTKLAEIKKASATIIKEKKAAFEDIMSKLQAFSPEDLCSDKCLLENQKTVLLSELEKIDINEEIVRAKSHLASIADWLTSKQETKGKKFDFTLQELNREINTIASKCSNIMISSLAIDIKSELEKCREQAQNIV